MVNEAVGLQATTTTWCVVLLLLVGWAASLPLLVRVRSGWTSVLMSLPGLTWLAFGLGILFRFFLLSYDAVTFGDLSNRLIERPAEIVNLALINAGVYWASFVAAVLAARLVPIPRVVTLLDGGFEPLVRSSFLPVVVVACSGCILLSVWPSMPAALVTPLSLLGSMWSVPATIAWMRACAGASISWFTLAAVLVPGLVRAVVSPYREHVLLVLLVPLLGAAFAARRIRLGMVVPAALVLALGSTVVVGVYRQIIWFDRTAEDALSRASLSFWLDYPYEAPWSENLRRFHVFDSLLLTVDLVPGVLPFSDRNVLVDGVTRGVIPRLLDPDKAQSDEGRRFQTAIWMFDTDPDAEEATAAIAPSMPGSLFEAGGTFYVAAGACLWGAALALIDRMKRRLRGAMAAGLHALCAVQALAGLERDYALAFSTLLQTLIVFAGCAVIAARLMQPTMRDSTVGCAVDV